MQGRIQKFFEGGVLNFFLYGRENLGGFGIFFFKNPSQIEIIFPNSPKNLPEYTPDHMQKENKNFINTLITNAIHLRQKFNSYSAWILINTD